MSVAYAPSYIDAVFETRDASALHTIISVRARQRQMPDECALFIRVLEWLGSDWQYYDSLPDGDFLEVCRLLEKFGMTDVLAMYKRGKALAEDSRELADWTIAHEAQVRDELFRHAKKAADFLKRNDG
jgi:hypothetical protein